MEQDIRVVDEFDDNAPDAEQSLPISEGIDGDNPLTFFSHLKPGTILSEHMLAKAFKRHPLSIRRAVERGELPPPFRLFGKPAWMVESILAHFSDISASNLQEQSNLEKSRSKLAVG